MVIMDELIQTCLLFVPVSVADEISAEEIWCTCTCSSIPEVLVQSGIQQFQPRDHEST